MAKSKQRLEAISLRQKGQSIREIAKALFVSSSTVSLWCKDVQLTSEQIADLERRAHDPNYGKRLENSLKQRQARIEKTKKLYQEGIEEIGKITRRELFIAGVTLYWAEGFKKDNLVGFCNSDPFVVKFFLTWLNKCFGYTDADLRLRIGLNISFKEKTREIEQYWANFLGISLSHFQKPFYQKVKWQKQYEHPENYHGVLRIRVKRSTDFLRKILGYFEGLNQNSAR